MTKECERWVELSDRASLDEEISVLERVFLEQHSGECRACGAEARVWRDLGACLDDHGAEGREAVTALDSGSPARDGSRRGRRVLAISGLSPVVAAAAAFYLLGPPGPLDERKSAQIAQPLPDSLPAFAQLLLVSGEVSLEGSNPSAGASLEEADGIVTKQGRACLAHGAGTRTCLESGSSARILEARAGAQRLELSHGTLYCRQSSGPGSARFEVKTRWGTIVGIGAEFITSYVADGAVSIALVAGELKLRQVNGVESAFSAPKSLIVGAGGMAKHSTSVTPLSVGSAHLMALWDQVSLTPIFIDTDPEGAQVTIDGVGSGSTPLSMMLDRGTHELAIFHEGYRPEQRTLDVKGAERVSETIALRSVAVEEEPKALPVEGPSELLMRAQTRRKQGQFGEAARLYQTIISRYPASNEAAATRLSLGELQLSQLGAPAPALDSFREYLKSGGPLRQEASYGEIRALRALGREEEARTLAKKFMASYPQSGQAVSLGRWLGSSEKSPSK